MADLAFAHNAGMQDGTRQNDYMGFIHKYMATVVMLGALRPLHALLPYLPKTADIEAHRQRGLALLSSRLKLGKTRKDLFTHLLDADATFTSEQLYSNSSMIIIAGTDTTSSTMTQLFRALALNPQIQKKMQCEIDEFCAEGKHISVESTKGFGYINAVISESLRLFNPVPGGIYAATPPSGLTIPAFGEKGNETFVPGNVQVMIPHLALMTDPRYFPKGDEFIPERWTGEWNAGVLDRRAYIPFGYGVHSCVGKQLALNEMRLAVASIVKEWDIVLGEQYDEKVWKYGIKDYHTVKVGELWAKFVPRKV
ncbi:high nitrogen upregulated cytochrome P450 monooxygenase-like protein 2 [Mollisia scopiformis]|uniref:High nitrogen upregulated cytochrome P450 monooxygenase-like protein 2 n=1 Tax=Mollisia scopiformis TaxID=149040 RepID=A0A132BBZ3_MOLSC|nr:high nitrogen upregulated cytochrome P450 monooxygenase-like protein 2 [Mollisia scopiformis]KUJ09935.1 high nitrogen upregulated cytochrome P450 monooxygenase-like protein 2 [Mollisia scopiformis]